MGLPKGQGNELNNGQGVAVGLPHLLLCVVFSVG